MQRIVFALALLIVVAGAAPATTPSADAATMAELRECGAQLARKAIALNGNFLSAEQIQNLMNDDFVMYYKENKTLEEIADYYRANYRSIGLDKDQVDAITAAYANVTALLGGSDDLEKMYRLAVNTSLAFIANDKAEVDSMIQTLRSNGTSDLETELAVCQKVFTLITSQKKIQLEQKLIALVPPEKQSAIKAQAKKFCKLLSDPSDS